MSAHERLSDAVFEAVAAREGIDPTELPEPMFPLIDPDALDSLFRRGTGRVAFEYLDYEVTVESSGDISVDALDGS
ncbi:HalOD1 output domain-containing protein [Haloarcula amylovorans]|uniref:HalOD1 output domain-containing protein n=1 Tax=Haloarcula amylovorans TaxID=2562280 RepID=UPI001075F01D|nr:HalOD1 output domain-containing protein [Halomicroarcula amylolytica]